MKKATLKDIAKVANVSAMTVSKVMNNKPGVSDQKRAYILKVAKQMNYAPNAIAQSLRNEKSKTLGVVLSDSSHLVTSKVLRGIQDCAAKHAYSVIVANTDYDSQKEQDAIHTLLGKQIDGLILVAPIHYSNQDLAQLTQWDVPFVLLMRKNDDFHVDTVINDNYLGGYQSVKHLIEEKCKKFQFLALEHSQSSLEREKGYRQALKDYRIPSSACRFTYVSPYIEAGYTAVSQLLASDFTFDALICGCDTVAIGAMDALIKANIRIPQEVKLMGYDGIDLGKYLRVPLSTVAQPLYEIGYQGVEVLTERITYPHMALHKIVLKSELILRESSLS